MRDSESDRARVLLSGCLRALDRPCWAEGDEDDIPDSDEGGHGGSSSSKV